MIDKEELKNSLSVEEIKNIACHLGSDSPKTDNRNNLVFTTICHNPFGDGSYKLYYYDNSKLFSCYTECSETFDIFELVRKVKKVSFTESILFVQQMTGRTTQGKKSSGFDKISDWTFINKYKNNQSSYVELPEYNENLLKIFKNKYHSSWVNEGISVASMKKFGILFDNFANRIVIPHYDIKGKLVGIRCRNLEEDLISKGMKYTPIKVEHILCSHPLSYNLYGIYENFNSIKSLNKVVVFEGEKSVLKMDSFFSQNYGVAVCGDKISDYQRKLIVQNANEVIIGFDKSESYKPGGKNESIIRIRNIAKKFAPYIKTYILVDKDDLLQIKDAPVDQGGDVFEHLLKNKIEVRTFLDTF